MGIFYYRMKGIVPGTEKKGALIRGAAESVTTKVNMCSILKQVAYAAL